MKKVCAVMLAAAVAFGAFSCKSTGSGDGAGAGSGAGAEAEADGEDEGGELEGQDAIDSEFQRVYAAYAGYLVLDGAESYTVKKGDTLTDITKAHYGKDNGYYFPLIMLASHGVVSDPELIAPGMELTVPSFAANIEDGEVARNLSPFFGAIADVYQQKDTPASGDIREHLLAISDELAGSDEAGADGEADGAEEPDGSGEADE